ncbi:MAG: hypothetical protein M3P49_12695, partial [Actinomycetota bacterium]|nr:hypothetical protein [Actinomycetota bacterium]
IYTINAAGLNADGSGETRLTSNTKYDAAPSWGGAGETTPPETSLDPSGPSGTVTSTSAGFSFSSEANSIFECKLDGGAFERCESPKAYSNLSEGEHTFQVRAIDASLNTDPTPASRTWTVDTTSPSGTVVIDGDAPFTTDIHVTLTLSASDQGTGVIQVRFSNDNNAWTDWVDYAAGNREWDLALGDGTKTVHVQYKDGAGNVRTAQDAITLDTTAPNTTLDASGPSGTTKTTSASFTFSSEAGATFECKLDASAFEPCASPKSYTALTNGSHTFRVRAIDQAGNVDASPASRTWTVDTIKPTISGMSPKHESVIRDTTPTVKATVKDNLTNLRKANMKLYINGALISSTKWSYNASTDLPTYDSPRLSKGKKTVKIVATDAAGNVGAKSWYFTIK